MKEKKNEKKDDFELEKAFMFLERYGHLLALQGALLRTLLVVPGAPWVKTAL